MRLKACLMVPAAALVLILIVTAERSADAKKKDQPPVRYVTLEFRDVEVGEFLARMSEITGTNIIFDERVTGRINIVPARRMPVSGTLSFMISVLEYRGYAVVDCGDFLKVLPVNEAAGKNSTIIIDMSR